ncbi:DUF6941 family protein [Streptosporangium carneum]|uniref:Uncharacterized protein n=1 Tax=Streptosporangium carneum TaxID=47481 RepID=A0A9W6I0E8_9ACTN|nr:hypothetical protein [Streptosporangium carneum]GLK09408.1 hypothetical protein GCM10017600_28140 [Streptosporangium carneum]
MRGFLVLCDSATVDQATGKVSMLGAGWSLTGPQVPSMAVAGFLRVPWIEARTEYAFTLRLVDEGGRPVTTPAAEEGRPLRFGGRLAVDVGGRAAGEAVVPPEVHSSFVVGVPPLPLAPGRYTWTLEVDGEDLTSVTFGVRAGLGDR